MKELSGEILFNRQRESKWFFLLTFLPLTVFILSRLFERQIVLLMILLYDEPDKSYFFFQDLVRLMFREILWFAFFFAITGILILYPFHSFKERIQTIVLPKAGFFAALICALFFIITLSVSRYALEEFPNSADEFAYLFQAATLSKGNLWESPHPLPEYFHYNHIIQKDGIRVGRFPPGWPLLLSTSFLMHFPPYLVNPILGVIALVVFYSFSSRFYDKQTAIVSLCALALTGFYIFNSASYFSHVSCMLATLLFVYCIYLYFEKAKVPYGLLAGFFLGMIAIIRYYNAVLLFIPFFVFLLYRYRLKSISIFLLMILGGLPCLVFLLWYNFKVTGNAFVPVTMWAYPNEKLGFVRGHTVYKGMEHIMRWILLFFYWSSPGILILYGIFLWKRIKAKTPALIRPEYYFFICLLAGYFFYYEIGGNQYGPRFMFEAFPFVVLPAVHQALQSRSQWMQGLLYASIIYAVIRLPFITHRENLIVNERQDVYSLVKKNNIHNAIVVITDGTCPIRPMPVGDLTRNDSNFQNDVLYANAGENGFAALMKYYKSRSFYKYVRQPEDPTGKLIKIQ